MEPYNIPDDRRAAELLAKYIQAKITEPEEIELNNWIVANDNYYLFEQLTTPANVESSKIWFTGNGINAKFLNKPFAIYETHEEQSTKREFYYWSGILSFLMILYYILIRFA